MMTKTELSPIIPEIWAREFYKELRPALGIAGLIANDFEGEIKSLGDKVKVQQIKTPGRAQILTSDNEAYSDNNAEIVNMDLTVDKMAVYPVSVSDWAKYQANPKFQDEIRQIIVHEIARSVDEAILNAMAPATSQSGVSSFGKSHFAQAMRVMNLANVPNDGSRIAIIDPYYEEDLVQVNEILSRDFSASSSVLMSGVLKDPIYSFKVYTSNLLPQNTAMFFHPSFMQLAIQKGAEYKEMDLEASTNVMAHRVRGANLFGLKQFDSSRVFKIYNT
jgi:hypothetical protein